MKHTFFGKALCVLACLVIGVSPFLPYLSVSVLGATVSQSLMEGGDGIVVLVIAAVALVCAVAGKYLPAGLLGAASFGMVFLEKHRISSKLKTGNGIADALTGSILKNGAGYYFLLVGSAALVLFALVSLALKKK